MSRQTHITAWRSTGISDAADGHVQDMPADLTGDRPRALATKLALELLTHIPPEMREATGVFLGMPYGSLAADLAFQRSRRADGGQFASPAAFARTLPSTLAAQVALAGGLCGPGVVVCAGSASGAVAVARASQWICSGAMESCLAGVLHCGPLDDAAAPAAFFCLLTAAPPGAAGLKLTARVEIPTAPPSGVITTAAENLAAIAALADMMTAAEKTPQTLTATAQGIAVRLCVSR